MAVRGNAVAKRVGDSSDEQQQQEKRERAAPLSAGAEDQRDCGRQLGKRKEHTSDPCRSVRNPKVPDCATGTLDVEKLPDARRSEHDGQHDSDC
jgi:hypothetical protein